jgi:hypothetical protein
MPYFDGQTDLLIGPIPWTILPGAALVALAFIASATVITRNQDFS